MSDIDDLEDFQITADKNPGFFKSSKHVVKARANAMNCRDRGRSKSRFRHSGVASKAKKITLADYA